MPGSIAAPAETRKPGPTLVRRAPAPPPALAQGRAMLRKAADWAGGPAAFAAVRSWQEETAATLHMGRESAEIAQSVSWRLPDRLRIVQRLPMAEMTQGYDGSAGWGSSLGRVEDQPEMGVTVSQEYERSVFRLFSTPDSLDVRAEDGRRTIEEVELTVARVTSRLVREWRLFFGPDGRLAGMSYRDEGPAGEATFLTLYDDWRDVGGGIRYPFASRTLMNDEPFLEFEVRSAEPNPDLPDSIFRKPSP